MAGNSASTSGGEVPPDRTRAGHIILARGLGTAIVIWQKRGRTSGSWHAVRAGLIDAFPTASVQSIEAVIRKAQQCAAQIKTRAKHAPDWTGTQVVDCRPLVRTRNRVRRKH